MILRNYRLQLFNFFWAEFIGKCFFVHLLLEELFIKVPIAFNIDGCRRGQFAFMSLPPLLYENLSCQARWATITMVEILMEGEATYLKAFEQQSTLDAQTLTYLSDRVVSKH